MHAGFVVLFLLFLVFVPFPQRSHESFEFRLTTCEAASPAAEASEPEAESIHIATHPDHSEPTVPVKRNAGQVRTSRERMNEPVRKVAAASSPPVVPASPDGVPPPFTNEEVPKKENNPPAVEPETDVSDDLVARMERAVHDRINAERVSHGLVALGYDAILARTAGAHSDDMLRRGYFAHTNQDGCDPFCRISVEGYAWQNAGENIYWMNGYEISVEETAALIVKSWMDSPGHRENILNPAFAEEGIGIAIQGNKIYATENFETPR